MPQTTDKMNDTFKQSSDNAVLDNTVTRSDNAVLDNSVTHN